VHTSQIPGLTCTISEFCWLIPFRHGGVRVPKRLCRMYQFIQAPPAAAPLAMDELRALERVQAGLPSLPASQRDTLIQFLLGSKLTFSYVCEHRDAYHLFCQLLSSGETTGPFVDRFLALLAMMESEASFEEFRTLVSSLVRREEAALTIIGKLAAKESFRRMFRQLLDDGWFVPREEDTSTSELMKALHAEFAYQEGRGPKPLCVVDGEKFLATIEEDERTFQSLSLQEPHSDAAKRVEEFFAKHPSSTWKQASEELGMSIQRMKRLRKKMQSGGGAASSNVLAGRAASREHQQTRELKTSMTADILHHTAYTQITFANGKAIFTFEPTVRGQVLWSEWVVSHPFPATAAEMDSMLQRKWSAFAESEIYQGHPPETVLGRLLYRDRSAGLFSQAETQHLYSHDQQRELYDLACAWYSGGRDSDRAAQRIKDIGLELYEMGQDAIGLSDSSDMAVMLDVFTHMYENTGRLPDGISMEQFTNMRRVCGLGHAAMTLHFIGLGLLSGVFDEVTKKMVPAARHSLPATKGGIVEMHHTKNLQGELEITGWQCVVEMLWHGIGQWEN